MACDVFGTNRIKLEVVGFAAVLLNTTIAQAADPVAYDAGPMQPRDMTAPSTPVIGKALLS